MSSSSAKAIRGGRKRQSPVTASSNNTNKDDENDIGVIVVVNSAKSVAIATPSPLAAGASDAASGKKKISNTGNKRQKMNPTTVATASTSTYSRSRSPVISSNVIVNNNKRPSSAGPAGGNEKGYKGLRQFSFMVCKKVEEKGTTTYNEVADELVKDVLAEKEIAIKSAERSSVDDTEGKSKRGNNKDAATSQPPTGKGGASGVATTFDEKNIRRRVYDALNVLMAMDIIIKNKKEIKWRGLPNSSFTNSIGGIGGTSGSSAEDDLRQHQQRELERLKDEFQTRQVEVNRKRQALEELLIQQISFRNLVELNVRREEEKKSSIELDDANEMKQQPNLPITVDDEFEVPFSHDTKVGARSSLRLRRSKRIATSDEKLHDDADAESKNDVDSDNNNNNNSRTMRLLGSNDNDNHMKSDGAETIVDDAAATNATKDYKIPLPFIVVNTNSAAVIKCNMSKDMTDVMFDFSMPFEINDDNTILKKLKLHRTNETVLREMLPKNLFDYCSKNDLFREVLLEGRDDDNVDELDDKEDVFVVGNSNNNDKESNPVHDPSRVPTRTTTATTRRKKKDITTSKALTTRDTVTTSPVPPPVQIHPSTSPTQKVLLGSPEFRHHHPSSSSAHYPHQQQLYYPPPYGRQGTVSNSNSSQYPSPHNYPPPPTGYNHYRPQQEHHNYPYNNDPHYMTQQPPPPPQRSGSDDSGDVGVSRNIHHHPSTTHPHQHPNSVTTGSYDYYSIGSPRPSSSAPAAAAGTPSSMVPSPYTSTATTPVTSSSLDRKYLPPRYHPSPVHYYQSPY